MAEPRLIFSVIIPSHNRLPQVKNAVKSVFDQTFPKDQYEIIGVDDVSTDDFSVLTKFARVVRTPARFGPAKARNFGASFAVGSILAFCDSDCTVPANWLEALYQGYQHHPEVCGVGGSIVNSTTSLFADYENAVYRNYISHPQEYVSTKRDEAPFALGNMSVTKAAFESVGGFTPAIPNGISGEDADLKSRLLAKGNVFCYVPVEVNHDHKLNLSGFYNQSLGRGAGMLLDSRKKGHMQSRAAILLRFPFTPVFFLQSLKAFNLNFKLAFADTIFFVFRNIGKLKNYSKVQKLAI